MLGLDQQQQLDQLLLPQAHPSLHQTQGAQKGHEEHLQPVMGRREHCKARSTHDQRRLPRWRLPPGRCA